MGEARALVALATCVAALVACAHATAQTSTTYGIGHPASAAAIARQDIDVAPDGTGLPPGRGDAVDGAAIFAASCQSCHGRGVRLDPQRWPYATTLFDYVRRAMPPDRSRALSPDAVYAITAYELNVNGILPPHEIVDRERLPRVKMPGTTSFSSGP